MTNELKRTYNRRSDDELIGDLEKKIETLKRRQARRALANAPSVKALVAALAAVDRAAAACREEQDTMALHLLADARVPLAKLLAEKGVEVERTERPRGRKPKGYSALSGDS